MNLNKTVNITKILLLLIAHILGVHQSWAQKYSIDHGKIKKSGRVGIVYRLQTREVNKKSREESRIQRKEDRSFRKGKREHMKKVQTKSTQREMKKLYRSSVRINKLKPQEYLHQRIYRKFSDGSQTTYVKSKLFVRNSINNIGSVFRNNTTFDKNVKKDFKISKN